ncbi:MAG: DNA polymerase beta superfamily protein [Rubrobacteraceae bacterium]
MSEITLEGLTDEKTRELLPEGSIFLGYRGSHSHGTYIPPSDEAGIDDVDLMGIFVAPVEHYLGFGREDSYERWEGHYDCVFYEWKKLIKLLLKSNPNVMGMLWLRDEHVLYADESWRYLKENRSVFASKQAYFSFAGYARSQFGKMTRIAKPEPERRRRLKELEAEIKYRKTVKQGDRPFGNESLRQLSIQKMQEEINGLKGQHGFMGAKRKALVEKHGHDVKNSAHLIRLLRMSIEFLETGELQVHRPDADELIAIKRGEWSLERTRREAERLFVKAEEAYENSQLPEKPDRQRAEEICVRVLRDRLSR